MIPQWLNAFNSVAWIVSNLEVLYISIVLVIFVVFYFLIFDPKATTAGRFIYRFIVSLVGVIGLIFIGNYIDPAKGSQWFQFPGDILWWRPIVRFIVYTYVAYAVTALQVLLVIRRWWPGKLRTTLDRQIVKLRHSEPELPNTLNEDESHTGTLL